MKARHLLPLWIGLLASCGPYAPPGDSFKNHFDAELPANLSVVHYSSDAFKDPQFHWELKPIDEEFLKAVVAGKKLNRAADGQTLGNPTTASGPWWWDEKTLQSLSEVYYRDPDATDGSFYRIWVDRAHNRLFILFENT